MRVRFASESHREDRPLTSSRAVSGTRGGLSQDAAAIPAGSLSPLFCHRRAGVPLRALTCVILLNLHSFLTVITDAAALGLRIPGLREVRGCVPTLPASPRRRTTALRVLQHPSEAASPAQFRTSRAYRQALLPGLVTSTEGKLAADLAPWALHGLCIYSIAR